ncbi:hypothetical protein FAI40_03295 [Acetobacteraceae bacterium]|nr:hypothetical protein FAI40_03295 [Acetobacteraceae bacterium]
MDVKRSDSRPVSPVPTLKTKKDRKNPRLDYIGFRKGGK